MESSPSSPPGEEKKEERHSSTENIEEGLTAIHLALNSLPLTGVVTGYDISVSASGSSCSTPGRRNSDISLLDPLQHQREINHETEESFYDFYRKIFDRIAYEELAYSDNWTPRRRNSLIPFLDDVLGVSDLRLHDSDYPTFGHCHSSVEVWKIFYDFYENFETRVSFDWLLKHDLNKAQNMGAWKKIERANRHVVDKAKKERNEGVKNLVAFVKSRDKRTSRPINLKKQLRRGSLLKALK